MRRSPSPLAASAAASAPRHRTRWLALLAIVLAALASGPAGSQAQQGPVAWVAPPDGRNSVQSGSRIIVAWNQPMNRASVEAALSVDPPVAGRWVWYQDGSQQAELLPSEPLAPGQRYTVTVATSARSASGAAVLGAPYRWTFTASSSPQPPDFSRNLPAQLITPSGKRGMPFQPRVSRGTFTITLYALDGPAFARRLLALRPGTRNIIDTAGLAPTASFTRWIDAEAKPAEITLPAELRPGLYVLDARHPQVGSVQTLLMYSDYALVAKPSRQGLTFWASRVPSGSPGPNPSVTVYGADGQPIAQAAGDADGIARFDAAAVAQAAAAQLAIAEVAGQVTAVGLGDRWFSGGNYAWQTAPTYLAHIHTDRPIYRPGHTVNFKATLRKLESGAPAVLAASTPISATIRDAAGNLIRQTSLRTDAFGAVAGDIALGDEVALGDWKIEVLVDGQTLTGGFKVEEYVKPDYAVGVTSDKPFYVAGETATIKVQADYYFGQPVAGGDIVLRAYRSTTSRSDPVIKREGKLDAAGGWSVSLPLQLDGGTAANYTFEAEVTDASRRPVYAVAGAPVHPAAFGLGLRNRRYGLEVGQPVELDLSTIGHDGVPAAGRRVDIEVLVYDYNVSGSYRTVRRESATTGADGKVTARIEGLDYGWYQIKATAADDAGRQVAAASYAWLTSTRYSWAWNGGLEIQADQDSYAAGDTARLLIRSPIAGTALVTLERDNVVEEIIVPVNGATPVEVPIRADYAPNVHARVTIWQPQDLRTETRINNAEGRLLSASVNLLVPAANRRLAVEVVPDKPLHAPGEDVAFTLRVRDAAGRPVNAQVALAVVDKAVLALAADRSGDIADAYWKPRASTVGTHDSVRPSGWYAYLEYDRSERGRAAPGGGGPAPTGAPGTPTAAPSAPTGTPGGPPAAMPEPDAAVAVTPRREFRDTAYWNATIETGPDGEATIRFPVPDNLTTWQALARAITVDTRAGQGLGEFIVTKPVIADPALPRFAVQGDEFVLDVLGRNYTGSRQDGACTLEAPGLVQLDQGERSLDLPFNETRVARWSVVASKVGVNTVSARLITPAGGDAIELPLEVQPFGVPERFAVSGSTSDLAIVPLNLPFKAVPDDAVVEIRLTPSIVAGIFGGVTDLIAYPYGCVEQTMSKTLPNAVIGRLSREIGVERPDSLDKLPEYMDVGIQKLYGFQHSDGSWGWWSDGQNLYMSVYVLQGLSLAKEAGYPIDANVLDRGFAYLARVLPGEPEPRMKAYAAHVMAENGRGDAALTTALFDQRARLDDFALAGLAMALDKVGRRDLADRALAELIARAQENGAGAHWSMDRANPWGSWSWQAMASDVTSTSMALLALTRLNPAHPLAPKAVSWLLEQRSGAGWQTTQMSAFAILALTDYVITSGELRPAYDWAVLLDNALVARGKVDGTTKPADMQPIRLAGRDLTPGEHQVTIQVQGEGRLYYTVSGKMTLFYPSFQPTKAAGLGVQLRREYMPVAGRGGAVGWHAGDLVNVRLTLIAERDVHYMLIEDKLPAGFEALNTGLATETNRVPNQSPTPWRWWGYERKEVRDDKVSFFASRLPPGTYTYEYAARAVTPGTFSARPAEAYAMYRPEVWGRSASDQVKIDPAVVADRPALAGDFDRDCRLTDFDAALVADAWGAGVGPDNRERDVNGDGRIDAADIATAGGRAGLACGDAVPLPPGAAGEARLRLRAPAEIAQYQTFDLEIAIERDERAEIDIGAWEATLKLPAAAFEVVGVAAGEALADARKLGPIAAGGTLRLGGYVPASATAAGEVVLAKVTLRALAGGRADIGVTSAQVVTGQGGEYRVTAGGIEVSPEPWTPVGKVYLPELAQVR